RVASVGPHCRTVGATSPLRQPGRAARASKDGVGLDQLLGRTLDGGNGTGDHVGPLRPEEECVANLRLLQRGIGITALAKADRSAQGAIQRLMRQEPSPLVAISHRNANPAPEVILGVPSDVHAVATSLLCSALHGLSEV